MTSFGFVSQDKVIAYQFDDNGYFKYEIMVEQSVVDESINLTTAAPDPSLHKPQFDLQSNTWVESKPLNEILTDEMTVKIKELGVACTRDIFAGFISTTTGHTYAFETRDQNNFTMQMAYLTNHPEVTEVKWKTEDVGVITHTRDDFLSVCDEAEIHKREKVERYWSLKEQVLAATSEQEIAAITW